MVPVHLYCTGVKVSSIYIVLIWFMPFNCETENVCLNISLVQVATPCFKLSVHFQFFQLHTGLLSQFKSKILLKETSYMSN